MSRVLFVADDSSITSFEPPLEDLGYSVSTVSSFEALKISLKNSPIEVAVVQRAFKSLDGMAAVDCISRIQGGCNTILVSDPEELDAPEDPKLQSVFIHLSRPLHWVQLVHAVKAAAAHSKARKISQEYENQIILARQREKFMHTIGGTVHDLKNIFMIISGYASISLNKTGKENPVYRHTEKIAKTCKRGETLCKTMLSNLNPGPRDAMPVTIQSIVASATIFFESIVPENITVLKSSPPESYFIQADPLPMEQALLNILINAMQAIGDSPGTIVISLECIAPGSVRITVKDTGCGIPKEALGRIFDPLFSTKSESGGLGLSLSRRIIEDNGGEITVFSRIEEGSQFEIRLPAVSG